MFNSFISKFLSHFKVTYTPDVSLADLQHTLSLLRTAVRSLQPKVKPDGLFDRFATTLLDGGYDEKMRNKLYQAYYLSFKPFDDVEQQQVLYIKNEAVLDITDAVGILVSHLTCDDFTSSSLETINDYLTKCVLKSLCLPDFA